MRAIATPKRPISILHSGAVAALAGSALVGVVSVFSLKLALVLACVLLGLAALAIASNLQRLFFAVLAFSLAGYAFLGKPFAYIGARPIYLDEVILFLAALIAITRLGRARLTGTHLLLFAFMTLGALRTIPYIGTYGIDALRDAVLWAYGLIAIAVSLTIRPEHLRWVTRNYRRAVPYFLIWAPIELMLLSVLPGSLPNVPGTDVPVIVVKGGDLAITLVGIGAFLVLGLYTEGRTRTAGRELGLWLLWFLSLLMSSVLSRGALVAAALGMAFVFFLRPNFKYVVFTFAAALLLTLGLLVAPSFEIRGYRQVSLQQLAANTVSLVSSGGGSTLDTTKEWRLAWWTKIVHYTIFGPYFWTGKGFGINLANADGFQVVNDSSLRAPHNSHMSVLARMGVPGIVLWIALQLTFGVRLFQAARGAWFRRDHYWFQIDAWLLAYWVTIIVASSFDLYLEGPQVGVWFWTIFGLGLVAMRAQSSTSGDEESTLGGISAVARGERTDSPAAVAPSPVGETAAPTG